MFEVGLIKAPLVAAQDVCLSSTSEIASISVNQMKKGPLIGSLVLQVFCAHLTITEMDGTFH